VGLTGPALTLLAAAAVLVVIRRRQQFAVQDVSRQIAAPAEDPDASGLLDARHARRVPRFVTGTVAGIAAGILLGVGAIVLLAASNASLRSALVVGADSLPQPPPEGRYVARVLAQDMNPTLAFADDEGVVALLAQRASVEAPARVVTMTPVEQDLHDNAAVLFVALGALTIASWGLVMWGVSAASPGVPSAGVE
jgi:hypothetical protein